jgi:hypothetical protein
VADGGIFFFGMALCGDSLGAIINNAVRSGATWGPGLSWLLISAILVMLAGAGGYVGLAFTSLLKSTVNWNSALVGRVSALFCLLAVMVCAVIHLYVEAGLPVTTATP